MQPTLERPSNQNSSKLCIWTVTLPCVCLIIALRMIVMTNFFPNPVFSIETRWQCQLGTTLLWNQRSAFFCQFFKNVLKIANFRLMVNFSVTNFQSVRFVNISIRKNKWCIHQSAWIIPKHVCFVFLLLSLQMFYQSSFIYSPHA